MSYFGSSFYGPSYFGGGYWGTEVDGSTPSVEIGCGVSLGTTSDHVLTRDQIITKALLKVGGIASGETLSAEQLQDGILYLNGIIRAKDVSDKNLWAIASDPTSLALLANTHRYSTGTGVNDIPLDMLQVTACAYRDATGRDKLLKILTSEQYDAIENKAETGDPEFIFLQPHLTPRCNVLYVWPTPSSTPNQSFVEGTDGQVYKCIRKHTASSLNVPVTGANYRMYWEVAANAIGTAWSDGEAYTAPSQLIFRYKRPLYDFDLATDNPDFPQAFSLWLIYALAYVLCSDYVVSMENTRMIKAMRDELWLDIFPGVMVPNTNAARNKARYI